MRLGLSIVVSTFIRYCGRKIWIVVYLLFFFLYIRLTSENTSLEQLPFGLVQISGRFNQPRVFFLPAAVAKNEVDSNAFLVGVFPTFLSYKKTLFQKDIYYVARVDYYSLVIHI